MIGELYNGEFENFTRDNVEINDHEERVKEMADEELRVRAIQELEFYKKDDTFMLADITIDLAIKALEQEPKTGHWIYMGLEDDVYGQIVRAFTCSECDAISIFRISNGDIVNGDLCPNCGTKMIGVEEHE